jgi:hypothetical protein
MPVAITTPSLALDDSIFSADSFNLNIPKMDGFKATRLDLRFSGSGILDRTNVDDLALLEAARLGEPVRLIVVGEFVGKGFRLNRNSDRDAELSYSCTVKVASVEAGEAA